TRAERARVLRHAPALRRGPHAVRDRPAHRGVPDAGESHPARAARQAAPRAAPPGDRSGGLSGLGGAPTLRTPGRMPEESQSRQDFAMRAKREGDRLLVAISGELDLTTAPDLEELLLGSAP